MSHPQRDSTAFMGRSAESLQDAIPTLSILDGVEGMTISMADWKQAELAQEYFVQSHKTKFSPIQFLVWEDKIFCKFNMRNRAICIIRTATPHGKPKFLCNVLNDLMLSCILPSNAKTT